MWFGSQRSLRGPPRALFGVLRHVAPQFADFAQHDAQEFLTLALDKIHEDLNRVQRKPYVEMPVRALKEGPPSPSAPPPPRSRPCPAAAPGGGRPHRLCCRGGGVGQTPLSQPERHR